MKNLLRVISVFLFVYLEEQLTEIILEPLKVRLYENKHIEGFKSFERLDRRNFPRSSC